MAAVPARWKFLIALWTVYLVWGSTYLAIKISVRTLPAFLSAGTRFLLAGVLLALILVATGRSLRVAPRELGAATVVGTALLALGVGVVTLAETRIDSSTAAMIAGTVPLQVILLRTLARERVALATRLSVLVGLGGLALVVIPGGEGSSSAIGLALALGASISWSLGSFFGHRLPLPQDGFVASTWQMLSAGVVLRAPRGSARRARLSRSGRVQPRIDRSPGSTSASSARLSPSRRTHGCSGTRRSRRSSRTST